MFDRSFRFLLTCVITVWLVPNAVHADNEGDCPPQWQWFVSEISRTYTDVQKAAYPILMAGDDGTVFDCFGVNLEPEIIGRIEETGIGIAALFLRLNKIQSNGWPYGLCQVSSAGASFEIQIVTLPYSGDILEAGECKRRISVFASSLE